MGPFNTDIIMKGQVSEKVFLKKNGGWGRGGGFYIEI